MELLKVSQRVWRGWSKCEPHWGGGSSFVIVPLCSQIFIHTENVPLFALTLSQSYCHAPVRLFNTNCEGGMYLI